MLAACPELRVDFDHPIGGKISGAGAPWKLDRDSTVMRMPPPVLGQDTKGVLNEVAGRQKKTSRRRRA
jgi:crotonobetainyl-CoA:carnitine CoA-transferase CaiB-like acyl-CoA transferase